MAKLNFTYLPGDGIGPEVGGAAINVLQAISSKFRHSLEIEQHLIGGAAIDVLGKPLPEETFESCKKTGAILLGAVGGPKWDHLKGAERPELGSLLPLRKKLNLYANIRPCKPYDELISKSPLKREKIEGTEVIKDYWGQEIREGSRVTWSLVWSCKKCYRCLSGFPQKCYNLFKYGHEKFANLRSLSGGFAEYCVIKKDTPLYTVSDLMEDKIVSPANCSMATAVSCVRQVEDFKSKSIGTAP